jgi:NitT/TauT family transport system substrate-binding protein
MALTRRRFGGTIAAGGIAAGTGFGIIRGARAANETINIGILPLTSHAPTIIAAAKGYFAAQGLDAKLVVFQAAEPLAVGIASGDIDFSVSAITGGLVSLADKGAVKVIGGSLAEAPGVPGQALLASNAAYDKGLRDLAGLKGKSYALTTAGSSFEYVAYKAAVKAGFPVSDLVFRPLQTIPACIAALKTGQVDAWDMLPSITDPLIKGGSAHGIAAVQDFIPGYQVTTVFTSTANVTKKREIVQRYLAGLAKGVEDYNAALVKKTMSPADTDAIIAMVHKYVFSNLPEDRAKAAITNGVMLINEGAALNVASVADQLQWLNDNKLAPAGSTMKQLVDTSFVKTI